MTTRIVLQSDVGKQLKRNLQTQP